METGITKNQIISALAKSPHKDLKQYLEIGKQAAIQEAEFFAHLIAWNRDKGQIRDSKVALPVIALAAKPDPVLVDNALAHIASLGPRELVRSLDFAKDLKALSVRASNSLVERYLRLREDKRFDRIAMQHRATLRHLYARYHVKPAKRADDILFKGKKYGVFEEIARLKDVSATDAAQAIMKHKIPFLVAVGALGPRMKEPDCLLALVEAMTPQDVMVNAKMLEKYGLKNMPSVRSAFEEKLKAAKPSLKASKAVEAVSDERLKEQLRGAQAKQLSKLSVDGDWLVLADKSGSMQASIELARHVSSALAKMVSGKVHLIFFDTTPRYIDATAKDHDKLLAETRLIRAGGNTSIGCGLDYCLKKNIVVDGIAIVSDGGDNSFPLFGHVYPAYCAKIDKEVPVYLYHVRGDANRLGIPGMQIVECDGVDYYSIPNLVATMRTNRYSLVDEIMETPLLTLKDVFGENHVKQAA